MLRVFERMIESLEEGLSAFLTTLKRVKADMNEAISEFNEDFTRTHDVKFEPITGISHDAPVLPVAASKSKPVDASKLKGKKLRAYADELGVKYHVSIGDDTLRSRIEEVA